MNVIRLSKYYLLIGIPWIIVSVIAVTWMYRVVALEDLKTLMGRNTITLSTALSNVVWPQINDMVKSTVNHRSKHHDHEKYINNVTSIIQAVLDEPVADLKFHY